jgi:hypothetical protein
MKDDRPSLTIIGRCGGGLRLVSDCPKGWEWESLPRREPQGEGAAARASALAVEADRGEAEQQLRD